MDERSRLSCFLTAILDIMTCYPSKAGLMQRMGRLNGTKKVKECLEASTSYVFLFRIGAQVDLQTVWKRVWAG